MSLVITGQRVHLAQEGPGTVVSTGEDILVRVDHDGEVLSCGPADGPYWQGAVTTLDDEQLDDELPPCPPGFNYHQAVAAFLDGLSTITRR